MMIECVLVITYGVVNGDGEFTFPVSPDFPRPIFPNFPELSTL